MSRNYKLYVDDILEAIRKVEYYTQNINYKNFSKRSLLFDAVVRNLEIIGEAVKNIPNRIKKKYPNIEWRKISGFRDIVVHEYFGVDKKIVWDIVVNKLPDLKYNIKKIKKDLIK